MRNYVKSLVSRSAKRTDGSSLRQTRRATEYVALRLALPNILALCLTACAGMPRAELAYQAVHAVDTLQTLQIARHPKCYAENDQAWLIGAHPSEGDVLAWGIGLAALHAAVMKALADREAPRWIQAGWQMVTLGMPAYDVAHNARIGLGPFSADCP